LEQWIEKGFLTLYDEQRFGPPKCTIPIFPVVQVNKDKIRPVFDFRHINKYVDVYSSNSAVCCEKLRKWRKKSGKCTLLDLKDAYMQKFVEYEMLPYQTCYIKKRYALTRRVSG